MAAFLLVPLSIAAGIVAGRIAARNAVRAEMDELKALLRARNGDMQPAAPAPRPVEPAQAAVREPVAALSAPAEAVAAAPVVEEGIRPEVLMVLTAAVAAFLGKKARIRRASLAPMGPQSAWAQQGRVFVQASHILPVQHR
jgi:methylmalonyl-CoA carboxyltransferase large subunit